MSDDDPEDPFDEFDGEYDDRDGDPFSHLDDATHRESDAEPRPESPGTGPGSNRRDDGDTGGPTAGQNPFEYPEDRRASGAIDRRDATDIGGDPSDGSDESERRTVGVNARTGDPFADVDVSGGDPFESGASAFEDVGVQGVDPDDVWGRLTGDAEARSTSEGDPTEAAQAAEDDVVEVSKHSFCEGCDHFSAPPDVHCTREGTKILEFTDVETVRVVNCPVVAERRELGGMDE